MLVKKGDKGEEVKFWQNVLVDIGYSPGEVDGEYGAKMEAALNRHRKDTSGGGPVAFLSGWHGFALLRSMMDKHTGARGPAGPAGAPGQTGLRGPEGPAGPVGPAGKDGALSGALTVRGGTLEVATEGS